MEELFSQVDVPEGPPHGYALDQLPGLSKLTSYDVQRLGLDQVDFVISEVTTKAGSPAAVPLSLTTDARAKLEAALSKGDGAASRREQYRQALETLHVNLLVTLTAANSSYGKAYGLGRALADTMRPHQSPEQMAQSFEQHRIGQLYLWLDELASLLPEHAARAVAESLTWWQQAVTAALASAGIEMTPLPGNHPDGQGRPSPWRQRVATELTPHRRHSGPPAAGQPSIETLTASLTRQGDLWRSVLDGDKLCTDLLTPQDYLRAGERLAQHYAALVRQALRSMPWLLGVLLLLLVAVVLVLVFIHGSAVARTATAVATTAGILSGIWKVIRTRVEPVAAQLEKPLWGAELNAATAEAVTCPPVGTPRDPARESGFEQQTTSTTIDVAHPEAIPTAGAAS